MHGYISMNRFSGMLVSRFLSGCVMLVLGIAGVPSVVSAADAVEWIQGGGFEQGPGDFEVYRYPRFNKATAVPVVSRVDHGVLSGEFSLLLPKLESGGGYRFVFPEFPLQGSSIYKLEFLVRSAAPVRAAAELFFGKKKISRQKVTLKSGDSRGEFALHTQGHSREDEDGFLEGYRIVLRIVSSAAVTIDDMSLSGPGDAGVTDRTWVEITPDNPLGVYGTGEAGTMQVAAAVAGKMSYQIVDAVHDSIVTGAETKPLGPDGIVDLITAQRGAYRVEVYAGSAPGKKKALATRRYAVIDRTRAEPAVARYGIAMEEHGQKTHVDGRIQPEDLYRLAAELGAGSVRLFSVVMPDIVSDNGIHYDFTPIDEALRLCRKYGLEVLVELGPNRPDRVPDWLRNASGGSNSVDLTRGLATKKLKKKLEQLDGKIYLDLLAYERYLNEVVRHAGEQAGYLEIWNEPGHKFLPGDFLKIAQLTRKVQREHAPDAKLVGYTSTKSPGRAGRRSDTKRLPGYLDAMLGADRGESIDVLSYHSAHAFKFMEEGQDGQEDETGYVDLIRNTLVKNTVKDNIPIWDTERGIPWTSDRVTGSGVKADSLEVARRLPGIYAASQASGVERLFWFNMASSTSTIAKTVTRYGFFDAKLEPMPHLAVYDAMTQLIGDSHFVRRHDRDDGLKIYFFENRDETILMAFNWRRQESGFKLEYPGAGYRQLDVMGNEVVTDGNSTTRAGTEITVDGWPSYLVFHGASSSQVRVSAQDHRKAN